MGVSGGALDADTPASAVTVSISGDGVTTTSAVASRTTPAVPAAYRAYGAAHGFSALVRAPSGAHTLCVRALNSAAGLTGTSLGCRTVQVSNGVYGTIYTLAPVAVL